MVMHIDVLEHEALEQEVKRLRREAKANKATAILTRLMDNLNQGYQASHFDGETRAAMRQANKFLARPDTEGSKHE